MVLLVDQNLPDLLCHRELPERFALTDALAIILNRVVLVGEIETQHLTGIPRRADLFCRYGRHGAQIVDLPRDDERMEISAISCSLALRHCSSTAATALLNWRLGLVPNHVSEKRVPVPDQ